MRSLWPIAYEPVGAGLGLELARLLEIVKHLERIEDGLVHVEVLVGCEAADESDALLLRVAVTRREERPRASTVGARGRLFWGGGKGARLVAAVVRRGAAGGAAVARRWCGGRVALSARSLYLLYSSLFFGLGTG